MRITLSRRTFWVLGLMLLIAGFVLYTRHNPNWVEPIRQVAQDYYLLPKD